MQLIRLIHLAAFACFTGAGAAIAAIGGALMGAGGAEMDLDTSRAAISAIAYGVAVPAALVAAIAGTVMVAGLGVKNPNLAPHMGAALLAVGASLVAVDSALAPDAASAAELGHGAALYGGAVAGLALAAMLAMRWRRRPAANQAG